MRASKLFALATLAATVSIGAHAGTSFGEGDPQSQFAQPVTQSASRDTVAAAAVQANRYGTSVGEGDRLSQFAQHADGVTTALTREDVRNDAIRAARAGQIEHGEASEG
ncbi:hypothetical protein [uncultured Xylophilus sp.]|uniref:hypothetical protein n=1 Tax=uncultured Xylophilus sp. TaxID=296832 RepID=UPI0025FDE7CB|nr:hypothetical protein [uncultured Xylophilus sp.]